MIEMVLYGVDGFGRLPKRVSTRLLVILTPIFNPFPMQITDGERYSICYVYAVSFYLEIYSKSLNRRHPYPRKAVVQNPQASAMLYLKSFLSVPSAARESYSLISPIFMARLPVSVIFIFQLRLVMLRYSPLSSRLG
jgi:hypothetical protein